MPAHPDDATAETLRGKGYAGSITLLSADAAPPCDRPNLSKDYLAGTAEADWIPLRMPEFYQKHNIDLRLDTRVTAIEPGAHAVLLADGIGVRRLGEDVTAQRAACHRRRTDQA